MAKKVEKTTALAVPRVEEPWEQALREKARDRKSAETLGIPRLSQKGGVLTLDGKRVVDAEGRNRVQIVPLGLVYGKELYQTEYTPGSNETPICYAFGERSDKGLVAHTASPDRQNTKPDGSSPCDGCQHNAFGTALKGRGKRCSDKRKIPFLLASDLARGQQVKTPEEWEKLVRKAPMYQMSIPSGSLRSFGQFLGNLKDIAAHEDLTEVVVEVRTEPNPNGAFTVELQALDAVPVQAMPALLKRAEGVFGLMAQPFPVIAEAAKAPQTEIKGQPRKGARR